jgi:uncharacterized membrane protein HdeD (DUF308 family)
MTAPRSASSGQSGNAPGNGQAGASAAGGRPGVVPRQQGPGDAGQQAQGGAGRRGPGRAAQDRFTAGALATMGGRGAWMIVAAAAVATLAVGVLLLAWPQATLTIVAVLFGAALVISGLYRLFEGFTAHGEHGGTRVAYIVIGLAAAVVGLYCLRHHDVTIFLLAFLVGAYWIIHGVADLAVAATAGPQPGRWLRVVAGLFAIAAGAVLLFWPGISLVVLLTVLGAWLLFYGLLLAVLAFQLRKRPISV